ncbi:hypothetical protein H0H87_002433 [Tephrocybe sp. NHM501043]|nr:hypothetical protein H0H87_002433 [Tephrocybe sp. NHM501043]
MQSDLAHSTRAAQRKLRQLEIEKEQRIEEAEALKMTEEQRQILHRSFSSVKVEFSDLDGLQWSQKPPAREQAFVVLTNSDLASFGPHETIRASASSRPRPRTSISSPNFTSRPFPSTSPTLRHAHSSSHVSPSTSSTETIKAILNNHRATRSRSPIKGLFPSDTAYESDGERTIRGEEGEEDSDDEFPRPKKERRKARSVRGVSSSSPSPAVVSARSVAKRLAKAVSSNRNRTPATAPPPFATAAPIPATVPPQTTAYPAYITYKKPAPPPTTSSNISNP